MENRGRVEGEWRESGGRYGEWRESGGWTVDILVARSTD